jgi:hypothetical protein
MRPAARFKFLARPRPITVKALQKRVGVTPDGAWGPETAMGLQRALNANSC